MAGKWGSAFLPAEMIVANVGSSEEQLRVACHMLQDTGVWFGPRRYLEEAPEFRQIIPYVMVKNGDKRLFYRRGEAGGEERLHAKWSTGFGGHVDLADARTHGEQIDLFKTVVEAAERELLEELGMIAMWGGCTFKGLIVSNETEVDKVHLGVVLEVDGPSTVVSQEDSQLDLQWHDIAEAAQHRSPEEFESWTRMIMTYEAKFLPSPEQFQ